MLPVVDEEGNLAGLLSADELPPGSTDGRQTKELVRHIMDADPVRFSEQASFAELVSFFSKDARALAIVTDGTRPTGFVTPQRAGITFRAADGRQLCRQR